MKRNAAMRAHQIVGMHRFRAGGARIHARQYRRAGISLHVIGNSRPARLSYNTLRAVLNALPRTRQAILADPRSASDTDTAIAAVQAQLPVTCLPPWTIAELPEPLPIHWRHWSLFIGPAIVMIGNQIGGGEWLIGPEVTAKYGGGLMWLAAVSILLQVFYNLEAGRYALYSEAAGAVCGYDLI